MVNNSYCKYLILSRCVFGFGFSLVCYVYSSRLVCFEPHYLLVICTRDPLLGQCVYVLFWSHSPVSTPTFFDCFFFVFFSPESCDQIQGHQSRDQIQGRQSRDQIQGRQSRDQIQGRQSRGQIQGRQSRGQIQGRQSRGQIQGRQSRGQIRGPPVPRPVPAARSEGRQSPRPDPRAASPRGQIRGLPVQRPAPALGCLSSGQLQLWAACPVASSSSSSGPPVPRPAPTPAPGLPLGTLKKKKFFFFCVCCMGLCCCVWGFMGRLVAVPGSGGTVTLCVWVWF